MMTTWDKAKARRFSWCCWLAHNSPELLPIFNFVLNNNEIKEFKSTDFLFISYAISRDVENSGSHNIRTSLEAFLSLADEKTAGFAKSLIQNIENYLINLSVCGEFYNEIFSRTSFDAISNGLAFIGWLVETFNVELLPVLYEWFHANKLTPSSFFYELQLQQPKLRDSEGYRILNPDSSYEKIFECINEERGKMVKPVQRELDNWIKASYLSSYPDEDYFLKRAGVL